MLSEMTPIVANLPAADFTICPLGDMHIGSRELMEKELIDYVESINGRDNCYVVIVGDCIDNGLKNSVTNIYEQTMPPSEQKEYLYNLLKPIKDKILCGVGGNHERRSIKDADTDPLYDVFCRLDISNRYRQRGAFLILRVNGEAGSSVRGDFRPTYCGYITHGAGGGVMIGSGANRLEKYAQVIDGVDFVIMGHTHKPMTFPTSKIVLDAQNKKVTQRQYICTVCSSWLWYGGYPMEKMLPPVGHCSTELKFTKRGKQIRVLQ